MAKFLDYDGLKRYHANSKKAIDSAAKTAEAGSVVYTDGKTLADKSFLELTTAEYEELENMLK